MCYKGKCMHCLEVETGSLIFAIFNIIGLSLSSVAAMGGLIYTNLMAQKAMQRADAEGDENLMEEVLVFGLALNVVLATATVMLLIFFAFGIVLLVGLCKRKAHLVKCYFVFSVVTMVLGGCSSVGLSVSANAAVTILPIFMCCIYFLHALILVMVHKTYKKFETEVAYNSFTNPTPDIQKF